MCLSDERDDKTKKGDGTMATKTEIRELAKTIKGAFRSKKAAFEFVATEASRMARNGDLPRIVDTACYGIGWALQTGRLDGQTDRAIRSLGLGESAALIAAVAFACPTMNDVPAWLIANRDVIL
jgi:hypothetical protein